MIIINPKTSEIEKAISSAIDTCYRVLGKKANIIFRPINVYGCYVAFATKCIQVSFLSQMTWINSRYLKNMTIIEQAENDVKDKQEY